MDEDTNQNGHTTSFLVSGLAGLAATGGYAPLLDIPIQQSYYSQYVNTYGAYGGHAVTEQTITREEVDAKIATNTATLEGVANTANALAQGIDTRLGMVETGLRNIGSKVDTHFYITWGGLIAVALGLAGLMSIGFGWVTPGSPVP